MVCSKNFNKNVKTIWRKESTREEGVVEGKFHDLTTFTILFALCLTSSLKLDIYLKQCILLVMWAQETHRYIYKYIPVTQRAQISQKQDGYNIRNNCLVITKNGFVATQALGHIMYVMYNELLHCIQFCW